MIVNLDDNSIVLIGKAFFDALTEAQLSQIIKRAKDLQSVRVDPHTFRLNEANSEGFSFVGEEELTKWDRKKAYQGIVEEIKRPNLVIKDEPPPVAR